jgi:DCN1-like protein 4/5
MCLPWFRRRPSDVKAPSKSHLNHTPSKESKSELTTAVQKPSTQKGKGPTLPQFTQARAHELFSVYCDKEALDGEVIGSDGLENFCKDTQLDMEGPKPLILAWILGAKTFGRFSKEEWSSGTSNWK